MAIVTSTDTNDSRKAAVAKSAGSAALGYLVPWTTPARAVAKRVARRRAAKAPSPARAATAAAVTSRIPLRKKSSRFSARTRLLVIAVAGVAAGGVVFSTVRRGRQTPPPVAAHPPRVEDVPTR